VERANRPQPEAKERVEEKPLVFRTPDNSRALFP